MRIRTLRRLPLTLGWMAKRPIPDEVTDAWLRPLLSDRAIRRDVRRYVRSARAADLAAASERLAEFDKPALVVWAREDRVMPLEHGRRLAALLPQGGWPRSTTATRSSRRTSRPSSRAWSASFVREPVAVR